MNQVQFLARLAEVKAEAVEISRRKNADYADVENAFANFEACEVLGLDTAEGFLFRMMDKMKRVSNLLKQDAQVKDEAITDTLRDLANYCDIFSIWLEQDV